MLKIVPLCLALALLAGCNQANVKDLLTGLEKDCTRHYAGSLASGVPATGTVTFTIDCKPENAAATPTPAPAAQ